MAQCVSLWRILQSLSAPVSEEHGWALIHQACLALSSLSPPGLLLVDNPRHLLLSHEGQVLSESFTQPAAGRTELLRYFLSDKMARWGNSNAIQLAKVCNKVYFVSKSPYEHLVYSQKNTQSIT